MKRLLLLTAACVLLQVSGRSASPIRYRFSFPEPAHRWMQVEATFPDLDSAPLELRMSRSSPGRYSLHDFAKNVYDVQAVGKDGREIELSRPDPYGWNASNHGGAVTVRYRIYGDRVDGTYLAIDETHAHINMPAAIMWAHGLDDRPVAITLEQPEGKRWQVATQLHPGDRSSSADPFVYTAPNLQYLMDSPIEFGPVAMREFSVNGHRFRLSVHQPDGEAGLDSYAKDVEKIVAQEGAVFGEFPEYEPGSYTFLADYLPWANGDGMEHRNSTVMTSRRSIREQRMNLLGTVAHEFFHCWNVERIRPQGIEPFDFDRANMTGELWLAEGFTQYYGPLMLQRAGLMDVNATARDLTGLIETVIEQPGRLVRSAEDMSRLAPFTDGGQPVDRTNWAITEISYYPFGGAIALAMDLSLRARSDRLSLDDFMRAMWRKFGKPGGSREGYVDHPYSVSDAEATLAEVAGDRAFAHAFFSKYIEGHEVADYRTLLAPAGFVLRKSRPGAAWWGDLRLDARNNAVAVSALVAPTWPAYQAGLEQDDEIQRVDGEAVRSAEAVAAILQRRKPGDRLAVSYTDRTGKEKTVQVPLGEDPHEEVVPAETAGVPLTPEQRRFRERWLGPRS